MKNKRIIASRRSRAMKMKKKKIVDQPPTPTTEAAAAAVTKTNTISSSFNNVTSLLKNAIGHLSHSFLSPIKKEEPTIPQETHDQTATSEPIHTTDQEPASIPATNMEEERETHADAPNQELKMGNVEGSFFLFEKVLDSVDVDADDCPGKDFHWNRVEFESCSDKLKSVFTRVEAKKNASFVRVFTKDPTANLYELRLRRSTVSKGRHELRHQWRRLVAANELKEGDRVVGWGGYRCPPVKKKDGADDQESEKEKEKKKVEFDEFVMFLHIFRKEGDWSSENVASAIRLIINN